MRVWWRKTKVNVCVRACGGFIKKQKKKTSEITKNIINKTQRYKRKRKSVNNKIKKII